jgi:hypothetical protein
MYSSPNASQLCILRCWAKPTLRNPNFYSRGRDQHMTMECCLLENRRLLYLDWNSDTRCYLSVDCGTADVLDGPQNSILLNIVEHDNAWKRYSNQTEKMHLLYLLFWCYKCPFDHYLREGLAPKIARLECCEIQAAHHHLLSCK